MKFQQDYVKFFDLNPYKTSTGMELEPKALSIPWRTPVEPQFVIQHRYDQTKKDFCGNFSAFLEEHHILPATAFSIATAVFERMADQRLHYHTPVHVLSMFQFVEREFPEEKLADWEELAIWFHDSVYIPQMDINEELSVLFMRAMVEPAFTNTKMAEAQFAIETTANHLDGYTNPLYNTVMDLDLASAFLGDMTSRNIAIRREFDYLNDEEFNKGRKSFLEKMIGKGFIFRSIEFKDKFEAKAMENLKKELENLENV